MLIASHSQFPVEGVKTMTLTLMSINEGKQVPVKKSGHLKAIVCL